MHAPVLLACLLSTAAVQESRTELSYGSTALLQGLIGSAQTALKDATTLDPQNVEALLTLALLYVELNESDKAIPLFKQVLELDPYNDDTRVDLILALWRNNQHQQATKVSNELTKRHPTWEVSQKLASGLKDKRKPPSLPSHWATIGQVALSGGYDTNIGLFPTTQPNSNQQGGIIRTKLLAGITNLKRSRPFTLFAHGTTNVLLASQDEEITRYLPSSVGVTGIARTYWDAWDTSVHLNYSEVFSQFTEREFSLISPTVFMERALPGYQVLRLLGSLDYRAHVSDAISKDLTLECSVRDTLILNTVKLSIDLLARRNLGLIAAPTQAPIAPSLDPAAIILGFWETGTTLFAQWQFHTNLKVFGGLDFRNRKFLDDLSKETSLAGEIGLSWALKDLAIYAQYSGLNNSNDRSDGSRDFTRHQVRVGVNYWLK